MHAIARGLHPQSIFPALAQRYFNLCNTGKNLQPVNPHFSLLLLKEVISSYAGSQISCNAVFRYIKNVEFGPRDQRSSSAFVILRVSWVFVDQTSNLDRDMTIS